MSIGAPWVYTTAFDAPGGPDVRVQRVQGARPRSGARRRYGALPFRLQVLLLNVLHAAPA